MKLAWIIWIFLPLSGASQCLSTAVDLRCQPCSIEEALDRLQSQVRCSFSYNAGKVELGQTVNLDLSDVSLNTAIKKVVGNNYKVEERGRHILILEKTDADRAKETHTIQGQVKDASTRSPLNRAMVYLVGQKVSTLSDAQGHYRIEYTGDIQSVGLSFSHQNYLDTILIVESSELETALDVSLEPRPTAPSPMPMRDPTIPYRPREVEELPMVKLLVPEVQTQRAINLDFLEEIPVQLSVVPSIGTNKLTSGINENILSLNLVAGYNAGVKGLEVAGAVNIDRVDVKGIQAAGIGNIVGGKVRGIQTAGIFNNVRGSIVGVQAAGVYNIVLDTIGGIQAGGVFNILNGSITGAQLGGVFNIATENMSGLQAGGVFNIVRKDVEMAQLAGVFNHARDVSGLQMAGLFNHATGDVGGFQIAGASNFAYDTLEGTQLAGFSNYARDVEGIQMAGAINVSRDIHVQIAGLANVGRKVEMLQLAPFNFADSAGRSIGLLSFSLKGVNSLGFSSDEIIPFNATYRTGSRFFYNILHVAYGSYPGLSIFGYGYGVGSEFLKERHKVHIHNELLVRQLMHLDNPSSPLNLHIRLAPFVSYRILKKHFKIAAGPTFNLLLRNGLIQNTNPALGEAYGPRDLDSYPPIYTPLQGTFDGRAWVGWKVELMW